MKLYSLKIECFRRHINTEIIFSDATFLIGENNIGKSSILVALDYLLNDTKKIPPSEFFSVINSENFNERMTDKIVLTAEFRNIPDCAKTDWRGFKGRILPYEIVEDSGETGNKIIYRKTFELNKDCVVELKEYKRSKKKAFCGCKTLSDYIKAGLNKEVLVEEGLDNFLHDKNLSAAQQLIIEKIDDLYDFDETEEIWFKNPGGIPANVLSRLPKFLLIPAQDKTDELSGSSGTLTKTLNELFNDVRDSSNNYKEAQKYLTLLAQELDPSDEESDVGRMMQELNKVMGDVFPKTGICAAAELADPNKVIKPSFKVTMFSNIATSVELQGTGMIRAAVFALLRHRSMRDNKKNCCGDTPVRPLLIGFEEPEIYLHPNAACKMRDTIYELASSKYNQIVCTTHSPYMIDLSKKPNQVLNNLFVEEKQIAVGGGAYTVDCIKSYPFNVSDAFKALQDDNKSYVKMVLKMDDALSRVFFAKHTLIVEGDTEELVLRETFSRVPDEVRADIMQNWQIVKARGKASIISLVKYFKAMGIDLYVIHDADTGVAGAEVFNQPILDTIGTDERRIMLQNCIEDVLGYPPPSNEKPYKAYKYINENWGSDFESISQEWRVIMEKLFKESFSLANKETV